MADLAYPAINLFPEQFMATSVAKMRQDYRSGDLYFCSPANYIFDFPEDGLGSLEDDSVVVLHNPVDVFEGRAAPDLELISADSQFPNDVLPTPPQWDEFLPGSDSRTNAVIISSGRFPLEANENWAFGQAGEVYIVDGDSRITVSGEPNTVIGGNKWYYTDFKLVDMNNDGRVDVLFARNVEAPPPYPGFDFFWNQLGWFEQPEDPEVARAGKWPVNILVNEEFTEEQVNNGPGASFDVADIDGDGILEVVYANFWGEAVSILHSESWEVGPDGSKPVVEQMDLDNTLDFIYAVSFGDVNNDGQLDIVVTNHCLLPFFGFGPPTLAVFEVAMSSTTEFAPVFTRHIIDQDFRRRTSTFAFSVGIAGLIDANIAGPANSTAVSSDLKPMLALTTDGGGDYYLYKPNSQDPSDWSYTRQQLGENECDFIAPYIYQDPTDVEADAYLVTGCLGLGYIYGGKFVESL
jgi:hypothetical protein